MHHMLHHTRNEAYWLAFIVPQAPGGRAQGGGVMPAAPALHMQLHMHMWLGPELTKPSFLCLPAYPPALLQVDAMFGTAPAPASVRMSEMAKQGLQASRAASSGSGAGGT